MGATTKKPREFTQFHVIRFSKKNEARHWAGLRVLLDAGVRQFWTFSSVRRFCARPSGLSEPSGLVFGAIGRLSP